MSNTDHPHPREALDSASGLVPEVRLVDLPVMAERLAEWCKNTGFRVDVVVYAERGARLLAWHLCRVLGCPSIGLQVQRRGGGIKGRVTMVLRRLPRSWRDVLRKLDERYLWSRGGGRPRKVTATFTGRLDGCCVLLVDDAADSGRTIEGCRAWLEGRGVSPRSIRVGVIAATTPAGRAVSDFWINSQNCRLPWSADSQEWPDAMRELDVRIPPPYALGDR